MSNVSTLYIAITTWLEELHVQATSEAERFPEDGFPLYAVPLIPDVIAFRTEAGEYHVRTIRVEGETELKSYLTSLEESNNSVAFDQIQENLDKKQELNMNEAAESIVIKDDESPVEDLEGNQFKGAYYVRAGGMAIYDPFVSSCSRFEANPNQYGISYAEAEEIVNHNRSLGMSLYSDYFKELIKDKQ